MIKFIFLLSRSRVQLLFFGVQHTKFQYNQKLLVVVPAKLLTSNRNIRKMFCSFRIITKLGILVDMIGVNRSFSYLPRIVPYKLSFQTLADGIPVMYP